MPKYNSIYLHQLIMKLSHAISKEEKDTIWQTVETPIIEDISDRPDDCLVTFLYREEDRSNKTSTYLWSTFTGLPCSEQSKFTVIPDTDIRYLTLVLPRNFRSAYNLLIVDDRMKKVDTAEQTTPAAFYPIPTGKFKKSEELLMQIFNYGGVQTDPRNKREMTYYKDYDNPSEFFGKESIIELPSSPCFTPKFSLEAAKVHREQCKKENRFFEYKVNFLETSLKNIAGYYESPELTTRKYWIYLPPNYNKTAKPYPMIIFLDGSDYLNPMPAPLILDKLIHDGSIPPCVAVFLEYSNSHRMQEYNCNKEFTAFLANDFMQILLNKNQLNITQDSRLITLVGQSASGLAVFYAALTKPMVFGNVIALSPSLEMPKTADLEKIIEENHQINQDTQFIFNIGTFETIPVDLKFGDGTTQSLSSYDANRHIASLMHKKGMSIHWVKFSGGHNYGCWRVSLTANIKTLFENKMAAILSKQRSIDLK